METITRREEQIMLAIGTLQENAYLVAIRKHLSGVMEKEWSIGAIHIPLRRLEKAGFIEASFGVATAVRGGRRKKIYRLTSRGIEALKENKRVTDILWTDFSEIISR
jgi:DNA-binding PadR family transcriptional regulator